MPRHADVPCIRCGRLLPTYRDSAPPDRRRCRSCIHADAAPWDHGTRTGYERERCRCDRCRAWAAAEARAYRAAYRERTGTGLRSKYGRGTRDAIAATRNEPRD